MDPSSLRTLINRMPSFEAEKYKVSKLSLAR